MGITDHQEQDTIRANRRTAETLKKEKSVVEELLDEEQGTQPKGKAPLSATTNP